MGPEAEINDDSVDAGEEPVRIPIQKIKGAYERRRRSEVRYRFVVHMASLECWHQRALVKKNLY